MAGFIPLAVAFQLIFNSIDNPRIAMLHGPDVIRLVTIGLGLGVGFSLFMFGGE